MPTNSQDGALDIKESYPVFAMMERFDLVLKSHGEMISSVPDAFTNTDGLEAVSVLNAKSTFLSHQFQLHVAFPRILILCRTHYYAPRPRSCAAM